MTPDQYFFDPYIPAKRPMRSIDLQSTGRKKMMCRVWQEAQGNEVAEKIDRGFMEDAFQKAHRWRLRPGFAR